MAPQIVPTRSHSVNHAPGPALLSPCSQRVGHLDQEVDVGIGQVLNIVGLAFHLAQGQQVLVLIANASCNYREPLTNVMTYVHHSSVVAEYLKVNDHPHQLSTLSTILTLLGI